MADTDNSLSSDLYKVLDIIGASEDERTKFREFTVASEVFLTASTDSDVSWYRFGSTCEGTTTTGLKSDEDLLFCRESEPVVETIENGQISGISYLMLSDDTKPGYFNLQVVFNGVPHTIYQREIDAKWEDTDACGRILRKHQYFNSKYVQETNGPAQTRTGNIGFADADFVYALKCRTVPRKTCFWLRKHRPYKWPPNKQLRKMKEYCCFFVGVGHPYSQNKSIEWRISFSLQERELMSSLSPTQHKCYILLKMIKKDIIQPRAGEKSISSYHCKTCLFHVLENSRPGLWTRRNLIQVVRVCLAVLLFWVKKGNCPNYFIPEENMFDRLDKDTLDKVGEILTDVLKRGSRFLLKLQCDNISALLHRYLSGNSLTQIKIQTARHLNGHFFHCMSRLLHWFRKNLTIYGNKLQQLIYVALFFENSLENIIPVKDYETGEVKSVVKSFLPHVYLQIALSIASIVVREEDAILSRNIRRLFGYFIHKSKDCDIFSSELILATCYLQAGMLMKCEEILLTCETLLTDFVMSVCGCHNSTPFQNKSLLKVLESQALSSLDFRRNCTTGCMLFLPSQANLVHLALQLEMYRSAYTPPGSRHEVTDNWFDLILVDSKVYMYFLQYLNYSKTNRHMNKYDAIENLLQLIRKDPNLGHKDTAFNLLGWIYSEENQIQPAVRCFQESWRIRPVHNAAKWHVVVLLSKIYKK